MDKVGLSKLTAEKLAAGMQSRPGNDLAGIEGRTDLLIRLSSALNEKTDYFGPDGRPGNMIGLSPGPGCPQAREQKLTITAFKTTFSPTHQLRLLQCSSSPCLFCGTFS